MTKQVTIVDYDCGNILSVSRAFAYCGANVTLTSDPDAVANADYLVLPGVGAFGAAMSALQSKQLDMAVRRFVELQRPFLGICIGMQLMMDGSEEFGWHDGFGFISGSVAALPPTTAAGEPHTVPHIGWSGISKFSRTWDNSLLAETKTEAAFYFVHSFHAIPKADIDILAIADYNGRQITAAVQCDHMTGVQFHPEKSGPDGLNFLNRFLDSA